MPVAVAPIDTLQGGDDAVMRSDSQSVKIDVDEPQRNSVAEAHDRESASVVEEEATAAPDPSSRGAADADADVERPAEREAAGAVEDAASCVSDAASAPSGAVVLAEAADCAAGDGLTAAVKERDPALNALLGDDDEGADDAWWDLRAMNKGDISNVVTAALFALGVALSFSRGKSDSFASLVLAFGLFGFAGGVTNWLAVKMLFDRIPGLIGSGVIPRRFQDILGALKTMIIETFFEEKFLRAYLDERSGTLLEGLDLKGRLEGAMGGPGFDEKLATKLEQLSTTPEGMMLATLAPMFGGFQTMVPMIKPMLVGVGLELVTTLTDNFDLNEVMDVKKVRAEIERVLDQRMQTLTPAKVKRMMSTVIKEHLGWLVVWGNVFGGLIGIAAWLADY